MMRESGSCIFFSFLITSLGNFLCAAIQTPHSLSCVCKTVEISCEGNVGEEICADRPAAASHLDPN